MQLIKVVIATITSFLGKKRGSCFLPKTRQIFLFMVGVFGSRVSSKIISVARVP